MSTELDALKQSADLISKSFDRRNLHIIVQAISYIEFIESELSALRSQVAELQRQLAHFQESEFHPDWSLLQATRDALNEYRSLLAQEPIATVAISSTGLYGLRGAPSDLKQGDKLYALPPNLTAMIERARTEDKNIIDRTRLFLESLPDDLGRGSLNGMKAQLEEAIRARGEKA